MFSVDNSTKLRLKIECSMKQGLYDNVVHCFFGNLLIKIMLQPLAIDFELLSIFYLYSYCTIWSYRGDCDKLISA